MRNFKIFYLSLASITKQVFLIFSLLLTLPITTTDYANRDAQYDEEFTKAIEVAYGEGHLASGGEQTVKRIFKNISLSGKKLLDFGCGLGGPSLYLAKNHSVFITAVDIESYVISIAKHKQQEIDDWKGLVEFQLIQPESTLQFDDDSFDIIYASESILHVQNKTLLFSEFYRVLKPGGTLVINDWLHSSSDYSLEMKKFVQADGLTFHLISPDEYSDLLANSGFCEVKLKNTSNYTLNETRDILDELDGSLGDQLRTKYDESYVCDYKESWSLQAFVFEQKEMLTCVITAIKK